ncbi:MAG: hypothetical protein U0S76_06960 [Pseudoxanthomonas sp.]|nr:hypothetical protein [Pseudoxanthomonas sp.]
MKTARRPPDVPTCGRTGRSARPALALLAALATGTAAVAEDDTAREERLWAVAAALATADAVREHCPALAVDEGAEARLVASTGLDAAALRGHEGYRDQAAAEAWIRAYAADQGTGLACDSALATHEALAPDLVRLR